MKRSSEIESLVHSFYDAMKRGDFGALDQLIADDDAVVFIGTDPAEWWEGHQAATGHIRAQIEAMGGSIGLVGGDPRGYEEGDVGWFADRPSFRLPDGTEIATRLTGVVARADAHWRVVQSHISVGVANEDVIGQELPT